MKYLKSKPGSIEEIIANQTNKFREDSGYQAMFKKELEKAGKGIGAMSPTEKKAFFNKIDSKYSAKSEAKVDELTSAQKKLPPALQKAIKDKEQKEDLDNKDTPTVKDVANQLKKAVKAHGQQSKDLEKALKSEDLEEGKMSQINQMKKDGKSAEEIAKLMKLPVDTVKSILGETHTYKTMKMNQKQKDAKGEEEPQKIKEKSFAEVIAKMWQKSAEEIEEVKEKSKYLKAKSDVSKTMVDTEKTKVDTKPEVSYDK